MILVCDNCLHLRQCLHPESMKKSTRILPNYYWSYFDLKREFARLYQTSARPNLNSMLQGNHQQSRYSTRVIHSIRIEHFSYDGG